MGVYGTLCASCGNAGNRNASASHGVSRRSSTEKGGAERESGESGDHAEEHAQRRIAKAKERKGGMRQGVFRPFSRLAPAVRRLPENARAMQCACTPRRGGEGVRPGRAKHTATSPPIRKILRQTTRTAACCACVFACCLRRGQRCGCSAAACLP